MLLGGEMTVNTKQHIQLKQFNSRRGYNKGHKIIILLFKT